MPKIIYLDIDGTLLDKHRKLSIYTKEILVALQKQGFLVALASGRTYWELESIGKELGIDQYLNYAICQNGAYITNITEFNPTEIQLINKNSAKQLYDFLARSEVFVSISNYNENTIYTNSKIKNKTYGDNLLPNQTLTKIDKNFKWDSVAMMAFESHKEDVLYYKSFLDFKFKDLEYVCSESAHRVKPLFMINSKSVSKYTTILKLNKKLNISLDDTYFFGDGINDVECIQNIHNSYVPVNAPYYVQQHTSNIIGKSTEDGVAIKLRELFLDKKRDL